MGREKNNNKQKRPKIGVKCRKENTMVFNTRKFIKANGNPETNCGYDGIRKPDHD
jgi:hypothetical protein